MIAVCVPFIILVFLLQTRLFTRLLRNLWSFISAPFSRRRRRDAEAAAAAALGSSILFNNDPATGSRRQGRKRRVIIVDGAKKAAGRWSWSGWKAGRMKRGLEDGELGRV
jgi:hypothetical protein